MTEVVPFRLPEIAPSEFLSLSISRDTMRVLTETYNDRGKQGLVIGNPGCGKTWAAVEYQKRTPRVVYLRLSRTDRRPIAVLRRLLTALGSERRHYGNSYLLLPIACERINRQLTDNVTRCALIIVDEAQNAGGDAIEVLRDVCDMTGVSMAFLGNREFNDSLEQRGLYQFASRCRHFVELDYDPADIAILCRHYRVAGAREVKEITHLAAVGGWLRRANDLLVTAGKLRTDDKRPITLAEIEAAVAMTRQCIIPVATRTGVRQ